MQKVIIITGPTGVGKTKLSIQLAKELNGEIISADSCQVYKGFDIGSAKISKADMQNVKHYLIDINNPTEEYSAGDFAKHASKAIKEIASKGKLPIIVGGTGLYINSLLYPLSTDAKRDEKYREELENIVVNQGKEKLFSMLKEVDPESSEVLNINQVDRIIRALEIYKSTGKKKSELVKTSKSEYDYLLLVLNRERSEVYDLINKRVDQMINSGLIDEVKNLLESGVPENAPAMKAIGYKEVLSYIKDEISLIDCVNLIKQKSRNYAKRQLTYFKKMQNAEFVDYNDSEKINNMIVKFLKEK